MYVLRQMYYKPEGWFEDKKCFVTYGCLTRV